MALQRGFKTSANKIAAQFRNELDLGERDAFDPRAAAKYLDIPILAFGDLVDCDRHALSVLRKAGTAVSGFTIFHGLRRMIVYNDAHTAGRINNTLSHEIAHALLGHEPAPAVGHCGCRSINRDCEIEADTLGGVLLLPETACLHCARSGLTDNEIAELYDVSRELATYRMNITAARKRVARGQGRAIASKRFRII